VLVTGGSSGIGRSLVELLAEGGQRVVFTYLSSEADAAAIEAASGGRAMARHLDLSDHSAPERLVRDVEQLGPIHGLVNNAGVQYGGLAAMTADADWSRVIDVNAGGAFRCSRAVVPHLVHRRGGAIVNVSSLAAIAGVSGQAVYAASKAALLGLTRSLAREVGKRNIRVNAVVPGYVPTRLTAHLNDHEVRVLRQHECLPNGTGPRDVAQAIRFLLSDEAAAITGQLLVVDAGASA
jgi:3-oxoacyl-[acyl-carrier protein] reductase